MLMKTILGDVVRKAQKVTADKLWLKAMDDEMMRKMKILNVHDQLDKKGIYADGTDTPDYAPITVEIKRREGKIWQHMNFRDTGETVNSIKYSPIKGGVKITLKDRHNLLQNYSPEIIGLTDENKQELHEPIIENIQKEIKGIFGAL